MIYTAQNSSGRKCDNLEFKNVNVKKKKRWNRSLYVSLLKMACDNILLQCPVGIYIYLYIYLYICTDDKLQFCLGQFFTYATLYSRLSLRLDPLLHKQGKMARYRKKKRFHVTGTRILKLNGMVMNSSPQGQICEEG